MNKASLGLLCLACAISILFSGCYRIPCEDDYSVIPATNNPSITRDTTSWQPGLSY